VRHQVLVLFPQNPLLGLIPESNIIFSNGNFSNGAYSSRSRRQGIEAARQR
jgi:hypothetical protein